MISRKTMLTVAISTSLAGGMLASNAVAADSFLDEAAKALGVTAESPNIHAKEGQCGGGMKAKKAAEGQCGGGMKAGKEAKCGGGMKAKKAAEGQCGSMKSEAKAAKEGQCGGGKSSEGQCGGKK